MKSAHGIITTPSSFVVSVGHRILVVKCFKVPETAWMPEKGGFKRMSEIMVQKHFVCFPSSAFAAHV
jgi:hypothetical protein